MPHRAEFQNDFKRRAPAVLNQNIKKQLSEFDTAGARWKRALLAIVQLGKDPDADVLSPHKRQEVQRILLESRVLVRWWLLPRATLVQQRIRMDHATSRCLQIMQIHGLKGQWWEQTFVGAWNRCPSFRWPHQWLKTVPQKQHAVHDKISLVCSHWFIVYASAMVIWSCRKTVPSCVKDKHNILNTN